VQLGLRGWSRGGTPPWRRPYHVRQGHDVRWTTITWRSATQGKPAQNARHAPIAARIGAFGGWGITRWKGRAGQYRHDVADNEHCEIPVGSRVYRVPTRELE
jgi:hypothetical protein